jgi:hypothetical protein
MDLELSHRNRVGNLYYRMKAWGQSPAEISDPLLRKDLGEIHTTDGVMITLHRYQGMQFGFATDGRYLSWRIYGVTLSKKSGVLCQAIINTSTGTAMERSTIRTNTLLPLTQTPWFNYSFTFDATYKMWILAFSCKDRSLVPWNIRSALRNMGM